MILTRFQLQNLFIGEPRKRIKLELDYKKLCRRFNIRGLISKTPSEIGWVRTQSWFNFVGNFDSTEGYFFVLDTCVCGIRTKTRCFIGL